MSNAARVLAGLVVAAVVALVVWRFTGWLVVVLVPLGPLVWWGGGRGRR